MADKILQQVTFYETDDGFRVEIKGDKEKLREMGFGPGMMGRFGGFGRGMGRRGPGMRGRHRRHHQHGGHCHSAESTKEKATDETAKETTE